MTRYLIVTADDVALHPGMTDGALAAHEHGVVTACSVVACGRDFERAADLLRRKPSLAVGAHLALVGTRPLSPANEVRSLLGPDGAFLPGSGAFLRRFLAGKIDLGEVERELRRQIEALLGAGLRASHVDGHQHLHVLPGVIGIVLRLAAEYGIGFVRRPIDRGAKGVALGRRLALAGLSALGRSAGRRAPRRGGPRLGGSTVGVARAGHLTVEGITELLRFVEGVTELVCHPGLDDASIAAEFPWGYEWESETRALCEPALAAAIVDSGVTLSSPAEPLPV